MCMRVHKYKISKPETLSHFPSPNFRVLLVVTRQCLYCFKLFNLQVICNLEINFDVVMILNSFFHSGCHMSHDFPVYTYFAIILINIYFI